ncbi:MAG: phage tail protein, partial [Alphaproteobacteria bacterium]
SFVLAASSPKPSKESRNSAEQGRILNQRQAITPWRIIYGQTRVGGAVTFLTATSSNQNLHMILTIAGHPVSDVSGIYFNEELIPLGDDSGAIGRWHDHAWVFVGDGTTAGDDTFNYVLRTPGTGALADCAVPSLWTTAHRQEGRAKIYIFWKFDSNLFAGGLPTVTAVVKGREVYDPRTGQTVWSANPALCIRDYLSDEIIGLGADDDEIDDDSFKTAANICEEYVPVAANFETANPLATTDEFEMANPVSWPSGTGVYLTTTQQLPAGFSLGTRYFVINTNPGGVGSTSTLKLASSAANALSGTAISFNDPGHGSQTLWRGAAFTASLSGELTAATGNQFSLRTGDRVRLATTGSLPRGLDPNRTYYWVFRSLTRGMVADTLAEALRGLNTQIFDQGQGTHLVVATAEQRYTCNGTFQSDSPPKDILASLLSSLGGKLVWSGGTWVLLAGAWRTPTITLDEGDLAGPIRVTTRISRRELYNGVKGTYAAPEKFWQSSDGPPVTNQTYINEDQGEKIWHDVHYPFTTSPTTFQRLAKIELEAARRQISTHWTCKLTAMRVQAGDVVLLNNTRLGWAQKPFEIIDWGFTDIASSDGSPLLGVNLFMRETDTNVYQWDASQETVLAAAAETNLPDPSSVIAPNRLTLGSGKLY